MRKLIIIFIFCLIVPLQAQADLLWNQQPDAAQGTVVEQVFESPYSAYSTYQVHDVNVGAGGWTIQSITEYFNLGERLPTSGNVDVRLNIFSKVGSLPLATDDPTAGDLYHTAGISSDGTNSVITLSGLSLFLASDDYWIGFTPIIEFGTYGQLYHRAATSIEGAYSAIRNPGGAFGFGTDWGDSTLVTNYSYDGAIKIEGTRGGTSVPEPTTMLLLGLGLMGLAGLRRKIQK